MCARWSFVSGKHDYNIPSCHLHCHKHTHTNTHSRFSVLRSLITQCVFVCVCVCVCSSPVCRISSGMTMCSWRVGLRSFVTLRTTLCSHTTSLKHFSSTWFASPVSYLSTVVPPLRHRVVQQPVQVQPEWSRLFLLVIDLLLCLLPPPSPGSLHVTPLLV